MLVLGTWATALLYFLGIMVVFSVLFAVWLLGLLFVAAKRMRKG